METEKLKVELEVNIIFFKKNYKIEIKKEK